MNVHLDLVHLLRQDLALSMTDWMLSRLGQRSAMTKYMHAEEMREENMASN